MLLLLIFNLSHGQLPFECSSEGSGSCQQCFATDSGCSWCANGQVTSAGVDVSGRCFSETFASCSKSALTPATGCPTSTTASTAMPTPAASGAPTPAITLSPPFSPAATPPPTPSATSPPTSRVTSATTQMLVTLLGTPTLSMPVETSKSTTTKLTTGDTTATENVVAPTATTPPTSSFGLGAVLGVVFGALACVLVVCLVLLCVVRSRRKSSPDVGGYVQPNVIYSPMLGAAAIQPRTPSSLVLPRTAPGQGHACPQCGQRYPTPDDVRIHLQRRHAADGPASNSTYERVPSEWNGSAGSVPSVDNNLRYDGPETQLAGFEDGFNSARPSGAYATSNNYVDATAPLGGFYEVKSSQEPQVNY